MESKRLFLGVRPRPEILEELRLIQQDLKLDEVFLRESKKVRWLTLDRLHLTLHFLGEVDPAAESKLLAALPEIAANGSPSTQIFDHYAAFPRPARANVFCVGGMRTAPHLTALWEKLRERLGQLELKVEDRGFIPHVTLARLKGLRLPERLFEKFGPPRPYPVDGFALYESKSSHDGARYEVVREFTFANQPTV